LARSDDDEGELLMAQRTTLDAMIPREDFAAQGEEFVLGLFSDLPIAYLSSDSTILRLLRKPDFQRETNHWTPEQITTFIASFVDNEVIPSLILWKSTNYIFVIDGGHRLSAVRAWMEDDYGDGATTGKFPTSKSVSQRERETSLKTRSEDTAPSSRSSGARPLPIPRSAAQT
jgi:hypothetical protein